LVQEVTPDIIAAAAQQGLELVCPRANALTAEGVQQLTAHGLAVRAWGVRTLQLLHHVVAAGAHGATVNWPREAARALAPQASRQCDA
jgi:glycerophosphoryl diester phosphodiesterase